MAAYHGQEWAVETLLRLEANRLATNDNGERPFQVARHNTVRSMLQPSVAPGEVVAASTAKVGVGGGVGRPKENDSGQATAMHRSPTHQENNSPSRGKNIDVQKGASQVRFGREPERLFAGDTPSGADTGRRGEEVTSKRYHGGAPPSTSETSDSGLADHASSLIATDMLEEGVYSRRENLGDDLSFEEGSSEGGLSLESEGGMR